MTLSNNHCGRGCTEQMIVSKCCQPYNSNQNSLFLFSRCNARFSTIQYHLESNHKLYNQIKSGNYEYLYNLRFNKDDVKKIINKFNECSE